jgi:nitrogen fixation/metabolism regulation signal transduction histidine kinase
MNPTALVVIVLTAIVAALIAVLVFAMLRFSAAARDARMSRRENSTETAFVTAALQEALTKMKAQEREMLARAEASERLSGEIVESLSSGLLVVASDGQLRILNPAGRRLLNSDDTAVGRSYRDVMPEALAQVIGECLDVGTPAFRRTVKVGPADRPLAYFGVSVSPLSGHPHGAICLFTDLTPVVEMEEQLRLKESLARVGELTAGIAHEFRNGLATIHGYARLFDLNAIPVAYHPHLQGIRQETQALGEVVTNFLNFARPQQLMLSPIDVRSIAERAADELRGEARAHGGDVTVRGEFPVIEGDDVLLRQAFSNLLRNAVEACVEASRAPQVVIEGRLEPGHVRVVVEDNGPGIAPQDRERIFRPFVTTRGRGTGLGLALVQKIIVTHNGRIQVASTASGGASFQIILPVPAGI